MQGQYLRRNLGLYNTKHLEWIHELSERSIAIRTHTHTHKLARKPHVRVSYVYYKGCIVWQQCCVHIWLWEIDIKIHVWPSMHLCILESPMHKCTHKCSGHTLILTCHNFPNCGSKHGGGHLGPLCCYVVQGYPLTRTSKLSNFKSVLHCVPDIRSPVWTKERAFAKRQYINCALFLS